MESQDQPVPRARVEGLVIQELPDEVLVYDLDRHRSHCLNRTAALVWRHCDGRRSVAEMADLLQRQAGLPRDEEVVWLALDRLQRAYLLQGQAWRARGPAQTSRRALIRKLGLAGGLAVLLPLVESIAPPSAAAAASVVLFGACDAAHLCQQCYRQPDNKGPVGICCHPGQATNPIQCVATQNQCATGECGSP